MNNLIKSMACGCIALAFISCQSKQKEMETQLQTFIDKHVATVKTLYKESAIAYWNASISGKDEDFALVEKLNIELNNVYTNKEAFAELKAIKESGEVKDSLLVRELDILYDSYLGNQVDTAKIAKRIQMETEIEKLYGNFRAEVDGKKLSDNEIDAILKTSTNSNELKKAWEASKEIGTLASPEMLKVVALRNEIAHDLGFENYHTMSLKLADQEPAEVDKIFEELDNLTRDAFKEVKDEMDNYFANRYNIKKEELMPWHYQNRFFQEAPNIYPIDLDANYANQDVVKLVTQYYNGLGLNIDDIVANSDLYEKPGKNQHAYCMDVDREGDVRSLNNVKPNEQWMGTLLHEFGHGVYSKFNDRKLPYTLRTEAHIFTTEAIAMLFGRLSTNPKWMSQMGVISADEANQIAENCHKSQRLQQLVFSRWVQVVYHFEKELYANPSQDLNSLWWSLVEKYQMIKKPEGRNMPDYASKIHIAAYPCYYHNYLLGEILASQLYYHISEKVLNANPDDFQTFVNQPQVGEFLRTKVFEPGSRYYWNEMIERATGEKLTAKYYTLQFVK